jgi:iron(III) transport system permease protein
VFTFSLYPYVYLLARTALGERAAHLMEAARLLGAPLSRRIRAVALPLARPAVAAGVALALMETLADFGVTSYFGIQTFTTGIYKAWLSMDNRMAAAQLATMLLVVVLVLLHLEHRAAKAHALCRQGARRTRRRRRGPAACCAWLARGGLGACARLPVLMGFVAPVPSCCARWRPTGRCCPGAVLSNGPGTACGSVASPPAWPWPWRCAGLCRAPRPIGLTRGVVQLASLGYAVPGAVIVVGLLLPVGWLQAPCRSGAWARW